MVRLQSQARNVQHDDFDNVLRSFHEWMVEKAQADRNGKVSSGWNDTAGESSYVFPSVASPGPSIVPNQRAMSEEISGNKPSIGRRVFRTFIYSLTVAALVAVAWQAYSDDETRKIIRAWEHSSLTWLSSLSGHKSSVGPHLAAASTPKSSDQAAAVAQSESAPAGADVSREGQQQLQAAVSDLAIIRRTVEQIASKQEQMAQDIATLQAAERDVNQKISALTTATAVRAARKNVPKTVYPEPAGQPASAPLPVSRPPAGTPAPAQ
jgi:hypothetical protein